MRSEFFVVFNALSKLSLSCSLCFILLVQQQFVQRVSAVFSITTESLYGGKKTDTSRTAAPWTFTSPITSAPPPSNSIADRLYCKPTLCNSYNGTHIIQLPHTACHHNKTFGETCGSQPHLLIMSERRKEMLLDLHNLARSYIAQGKVPHYEPAAHMPMLKWDNELQYLATLHVKECRFEHDLCRNTPRFEFSGQNIGYFWIGREFKSHSRRMKSFVASWFKEYKDANMSFIESYHAHPKGKKIGHFTMLVGDRVHRVGCAAIRFRDPNQPDDMKFLMTCNYDFNNIYGEKIYQTGATASKCSYKVSEKYPGLCDWKDAIYDYDSEESLEDDETNALDNNIL